jgi:hypothetical protein
VRYSLFAWGKLRLKTLSLEIPDGVSASAVKALMGRREIPAATTTSGRRVLVRFGEEIRVALEQTLQFTFI